MSPSDKNATTIAILGDCRARSPIRLMESTPLLLPLPTPRVPDGWSRGNEDCASGAFFFFVSRRPRLPLRPGSIGQFPIFQNPNSNFSPGLPDLFRVSRFCQSLQWQRLETHFKNLNLLDFKATSEFHAEKRVPGCWQVTHSQRIVPTLFG